MARNIPRLIYIVLDGGSDSVEYGETSFEKAHTPNLDELARRSKAGMVHVLGVGVAPQSDAATLSLLGYNPYKYRVGRGLLEALGLGIRVKKGNEVAFRGNIATVDIDDNIIDRRCGRDIDTEESKKLLEAVKYLELGIYDGYAYTYPSKGHRAVVVIGSRRHRLSSFVSNIDPAYKRIGYISEAVRDPPSKVLKCEPLESSEAARITAELVNRYYEMVKERLFMHSENIKRKESGRLPCNAILLRDASTRPENIPLFQHLYEFKMASVVEMPVERGIAELIGLIIGDIPEERDIIKRYKYMAERAIGLLEYSDAVYIHIKGADEPAHDGDIQGKVEALEKIDKYFIGILLDRLDLDRNAFLITCDHSTPPQIRGHSSDPVPIYLYKNGLKGDGLSRFSEREALKGSLGIFTGGWDIIPIVKRILWG